jgi:hypothetical protein
MRSDVEAKRIASSNVASAQEATTYFRRMMNDVQLYRRIMVAAPFGGISAAHTLECLLPGNAPLMQICDRGCMFEEAPFTTCK